MKSESFLKFVLVSLVIYISLIVFLVVPSMAEKMALSYSDFSALKVPGLVLVYLSLIPFYYASVEVWKILKMVEEDRVFTSKATKSLDAIKYAATVDALIYTFALFGLAVLRLPFSSAYLTVIIACLGAIAIALFSSLIKKVMLKAIDYKEENDLTI